ncbi:elongation factor Ts [Candidatus Woesebacteria bacterium]|jgi:elongation factor Ts|nr:elongation factor Ts [Candidatus Woesebacteria bacterium]MBP6883231.1 elongation factor Ts [Candidatus Woesebacteria bacterium]
MPSADIKKLKQLRDETEVSFSLIKKALEETDNDIAKAKKKLQDWGAEKVTKVAGRSTSQGGIYSYIHHDGKTAGLVELLCETDFVSGNSDFKSFGREIAMQVASFNPKNAEELLKQEYIRDSSKTIEDLLKEAVLKFGENIKISRILRWKLND